MKAAYNRPVVWVRVFILIASLQCCRTILLDLWSGFYNNRYWFLCRYFYLGVVSLTFATTAVKLSTDMTSPVDITAKFGSLAFMCTMITNIMPSLASKDTKELLSIVIRFAILIITINGNT
ncbi:unnamed protein product [Lactuca virosa]|uniref:WAT1-related protein n=1 Tax=Lactuca virosa TaxID=75947 RepID=A0AAU9PM32_9ASTR|nr:unnamed protein product [Lactuca virosa]